jgi:uncharacterized protein YndB with AHSA1/START domain
VWKAWTEPGQIKEWLGWGEGMTIESVKVDLRIGGKFSHPAKNGGWRILHCGRTYLEVKAPERLVYTWDWEKDGGGTKFGELRRR